MTYLTYRLSFEMTTQSVGSMRTRFSPSTDMYKISELLTYLPRTVNTSSGEYRIAREASECGQMAVTEMHSMDE